MKRANLLFYYRSQKKAVTMKHVKLSLHFSCWKTTVPMKRVNLLFHYRSQKKLWLWNTLTYRYISAVGKQLCQWNELTYCFMTEARKKLWLWNELTYCYISAAGNGERARTSRTRRRGTSATTRRSWPNALPPFCSWNCLAGHLHTFNSCSTILVGCFILAGFLWPMIRIWLLILGWLLIPLILVWL